MFRTMSSALLLAAICAADAEAEPVTFCVKGKSGIAVKFARGTKPVHPCSGWQWQVTLDASVLPSPQETTRALAQQLPAAIEIEGTRGGSWTLLHSFEESGAEIILDFIDSDNSLSPSWHGCVLWFLVRGPFAPNEEPILELNGGSPVFFTSINQYNVGYIEDSQAVQAAMVVGPVFQGEAQIGETMRFSLDGIEIYTFHHPWWR